MDVPAFHIRPWDMSDLDDLVYHANDPDIARFLTNAFPHPYTFAAGKGFIEMTLAQNPVHVFAIEVEGKAAGGIGIHPQTDILCKNAELGYWLAQKYWGRGIITEAVNQMVEFGFKTFDITRIFARPFGNNPASARVLEKAGFILEARIENNIYKNGEFLDELIYAIRKK